MKYIIIQKEIKTACGISRTSENFLDYYNSDECEVWTLFADKNAPLMKYDGRVKVFKFILSLLRNISLNSRNSTFISTHRKFDLLLYILSFFIKVKFLTVVQSKTTGRKLFSYKAGYLIAVSNAIKNQLITYFGISEKRIDVIHNFVNLNKVILSKSILEQKKELKIDENSFVIGFTGRFDIEEKGIDILLKSFEKLIRSGYKFILVMTGSGKDDYLIKEYNKKLKENIIFFESKENIYNYINIFDLFILPSRIDPCPLVMFEAGALKKPVIASNVDGIPEIIIDKKTGLLFEPENVQDLTDKIIKLYNNKELREELGNNLFKYINENYTTETQFPKYENVFKKITD